MNEFRITPQALVNVVIASGLALLFSSAPFGPLTTVGGITLLLILFSYDQGAQRSGFQSLAFGAVCAFPFTLAAGLLLQQLAGPQNLKIGLALTWLCATILATAIDRSRMGARPASQAVPYPVSQVAAPASQPQHVAPPSRYGLGLGGPPPVTEHSTAVRAEPPPPAYTPPAPAPEPPPTYYQPVPTPPPPPPVPIPEQVQPVFAAPPAPSIPPPPPAMAPANPVAVTIIHVSIIGQGISLLRPVQAEHIARDIYRILEPMPEGERWKYETGQAVRCRKQKLSSGKALVAYEEVILQRVG